MNDHERSVMRKEKDVHHISAEMNYVNPNPGIEGKRNISKGS
jgi:hypothetical protein